MGTTSATATWPADIVHVNEDGWVLINRGRTHGVLPGLRLLVVGEGIRALHNLFAPEAQGPSEESAPMLRIRRIYEQLEVIHAEPACAIAIATRTPPERRPSVYRGPEGELLVWVPLPADFTWPRPGEQDSSAQDASPYVPSAELDGAGEAADQTGEGVSEGGELMTDTPPEHAEQEDERWEEALPLNGVSVGDLVVPAIPAVGSQVVALSTTGPDSLPAPGEMGQGMAGGEPHANPFETGRDYDWIKPGS
jgi:hypothetical protein